MKEEKKRNDTWITKKTDRYRIKKIFGEKRKAEGKAEGEKIDLKHVLFLPLHFYILRSVLSPKTVDFQGSHFSFSGRDVTRSHIQYWYLFSNTFNCNISHCFFFFFFGTKLNRSFVKPIGKFVHWNNWSDFTKRENRVLQNGKVFRLILKYTRVDGWDTLALGAGGALGWMERNGVSDVLWARPNNCLIKKWNERNKLFILSKLPLKCHP